MILIRTEIQWIDVYRHRGALWIHDGKPQRPHVVLRSGKHSNGFFDSELVVEDPIILDDAAHDLAGLVAEAGLDLNDVVRVVGPAMGAITLAHDLTRHISHRRLWNGIPILRAYTEKEDSGGVTRMVFKRTKIGKSDRVLLVEDVLTTGASVELSAQAVLDAGGSILPFVATLVNRSGMNMVNGKTIVSLIDKPMPMWPAADCPLCKQGSPALANPKMVENWARLNAQY